MISLNATESAIKAGYKEKTAFVIGYENLKKPYIKAEIEARLQKRAKDNGITAEYVLQGIKAIADKQGIRENDTLKAYELLGKHLSLFTEVVKSENININHDVSSLTDEELEKELNSLK